MPMRMCEGLGVITREVAVRVINISATGCLIETRRRMDVGAVAALRIRFGDEDCIEDVQVVRCQPLAGAGAIYHVGMNFLLTTPRSARSIRHAVARHAAERRTPASIRSVTG